MMSPSYKLALDQTRTTNDWVWHAGALEGMAAAALQAEEEKEKDGG